nr:hypothetical protein [Burkholderia sp. MS389]
MAAGDEWKAPSISPRIRRAESTKRLIGVEGIARRRKRDVRGAIPAHACRFLHDRPVFLHGVDTASSKLGMCRTAETASVRAMTFIHPFPTFDVTGRRLRAGAPANVVPSPPPRPRVQLPVTLTADSVDAAHARLAALLHSPLGVYVVSARAVRNVIHVQFDIAPEDLDFALHTLIAQQVDAVIGPVARRLCVRPAVR